MQIVAISPQAKDRLSKSVRQYLTDFGAAECRRDFELPFWLRLAFVPKQDSGSAKTLSFPPVAENIGESRTSIHHEDKKIGSTRMGTPYFWSEWRDLNSRPLDPQ